MRKILLLLILLCLFQPIAHSKSVIIKKVTVKPVKVTSPAPTTPSTPATPTTSGSTDLSQLFQMSWDPFWLSPIPSGASYTPFKTANDPSSGFHAAHIRMDLNYQVAVSYAMPTVDIYQAGSWVNRSSGTVMGGRTPLPSNFVLPDTNGVDTPNNPTIILNTDNKTAVYLNAAARPSSGGPIWGYISGDKQATHGGSGIIGGELTLQELKNNRINHALAINVWGRKYLSKLNGGFVPPAVKADSTYLDSSTGDYYGGSIANLKMGSRVAIPPTVSAQSLNIQSAEGLALYNALKTYGAYIVDNSAWDALYINTTPDVEPVLMNRQDEISRLFGAMQIVK